MASDIRTSSDSSASAESKGDIEPDPAGPSRCNSTGPESQQISSDAAWTFANGIQERSIIAHSMTGLVARIAPYTRI